jgi:hypothetical protein
MIPETIRIDELLLRLPGVDEVAARRIAAEVAERLARAVGRTEMYPLPVGAALKVRVPSGIAPEQLAETIADRILEALR